jgi:GT2 family glycosyltransferase
MEDPSVGILVGRVDYPSDASWSLRLLGAYEEAKKEYVLDRCGPEYHFANGNNMAVRASVFQQIGLFRAWRRAGDSELVHRLASRRPDLRVAYEPSMRVTHCEFMKAHRRLRRLQLYSETNSQIPDFRELDTGLRLRVLGHLIAGGARFLLRRGR